MVLVVVVLIRNPVYVQSGPGRRYLNTLTMLGVDDGFPDQDSIGPVSLFT